MNQPAQDYSNHRRIDPAFHFAAGPLALLAGVLGLANLTWVSFTNPSIGTLLPAGAIAVGGLALIFLAGLVRTYPIRVQDRVIGVEVARRYERLASESFHELAEKLRPGQVAALRFAGDAELVELARRAARENLSGDTIKQSIKAWRADHRRV